MGDTYLIEIRLARTRWRIKETTRVIARQFGVGRYREHHPHVTLYGPFTLDNPAREQDLLYAVAACAARNRALPFIVGEWERREGMHGGVVAFSVRPSPALTELVTTLARALSGFTISLNPWDLQPDRKWFHATIANRLPPGKAGEMMEGLAIMERRNLSTSVQQSLHLSLRVFLAALHRTAGLFLGYLGHQVRPVLLDDAGLRITVMHNDVILGEYDLPGQRWLTTEEIRDPRSWQESMGLYRKAVGFELSGPVLHPPGEIFLISDLHLGHVNIIRYCSRPFIHTDVSEMDSVLINNWNYCVSESDCVYFLGDLRYGRNARPETEYRALLKGDITFVAGNHDRSLGMTVPSATLTCEGMGFLLVHDPEDAPAGYAGWVIHGHHHNNDLRAFPFIDPIRKRINVSAEVIGYCPVSLQEICQTLRDTVIPSGEPLLLRYPYVH
jgi:calcineurin-like phosphoesterase family protein